MAGWTDDMIKKLKQMWSEGLTTGEIGKRLGVSKNSIVGKVHRLKLIARPSPIKKKDESTTDKKDKPETPVKEAPKPAEKKVEKKEEVKKADPAPKVEPKVKPREELIKEIPITCAAPKKHGGKVGVTDLDNHTCRWPLGDPRDENFHFCGKKVRLGNTYCDEHAAVAYVKSLKK